MEEMEEKGLFIHLRNFEGDEETIKVPVKALIKQPKKIRCGKEIAGKIRKPKND